MNSDSVSPGSNPGSPANISLAIQGVSVPDKSDIPEQSADIGRTETGTVSFRTPLCNAVQEMFR